MDKILCIQKTPVSWLKSGLYFICMKLSIHSSCPLDMRKREMTSWIWKSLFESIMNSNTKYDYGMVSNATITIYCPIKQDIMSLVLLFHYISSPNTSCQWFDFFPSEKIQMSSTTHQNPNEDILLQATIDITDEITNKKLPVEELLRNLLELQYVLNLLSSLTKWLESDKM